MSPWIFNNCFTGSDGKEHEISRTLERAEILLSSEQIEFLPNLDIVNGHVVYEHGGENLSPIWAAHGLLLVVVCFEDSASTKVDFRSLFWSVCRLNNWWDFSVLLMLHDWSSSRMSSLSVAVPIFIISNETMPADSTIAGVLLLLLKPTTNINKAIVDSRLRPQSCCHLANCDSPVIHCNSPIFDCNTFIGLF